mmetsp:Transcript_56668/g.151759  ORF Transcript_56668/g.151759 Transcript_56668/m.151759 type:complete len:196 (-) Transcript_56668:326-913(-)
MAALHQGGQLAVAAALVVVCDVVCTAPAPEEQLAQLPHVADMPWHRWDCVYRLQNHKQPVLSEPSACACSAARAANFLCAFISSTSSIAPPQLEQPLHCALMHLGPGGMVPHHPAHPCAAAGVVVVVVVVFVVPHTEHAPHSWMPQVAALHQLGQPPTGLACTGVGDASAAPASAAPEAQSGQEPHSLWNMPSPH